MADGSTLIAVSQYAMRRAVVLHSVTRRCLPNRELGDQGATTITFSSRLWVNAVAPRRGGGAIVAGAYGHGPTHEEWVVGEVTPHGRLDPRFGNGGWAVLPFRGEVTAVLQEPSGRIVIGGDNGGGGCCTVNWAAAVSARGRLDRGFGARGRVELPTGVDSGVEGLALEPNGDVLANVVYGNMGCDGVGLALLTPGGRPVPLFQTRLARFWRGFGFRTFVGDAYVDDNGFTLVGTGRKRCVEKPWLSAPLATGLISRFRAGGEPASRTIRFPSRMADGFPQAFHEGTDTFVVRSPSADSGLLILTARRPDGSTDSRFGKRGRAWVHTPWRGPNATLETIFSIGKASPRAIVVIATRYGGHQLQVIRLRL